MTKQRIYNLLAKGLGLEIEFKGSCFDLSKTIFDAICIFLDRQGDHLLLGVKNDGAVEGVLESETGRMVNEIVINVNNLLKLNPQSYLSPEEVDYDGKKIIHVYVPECSQEAVIPFSISWHYILCSGSPCISACSLQLITCNLDKLTYLNLV
jgi:ATP-dependent DNA helicase RecG